MISVGNRIKARRKELGLSADEVAQKTGISRATLYRYESPDIYKVPIQFLEDIAVVLKTTPDVLIGTNVERDKWIEENTIPVSKIAKLPIIGIVRAGVGGITYEDNLGEEYVETSALGGHQKEEFFWLKVKGDSMVPRLFENDLVLVRKQTSVQSGDYAVVLVDDEEGVVKRVTYDETSVTLHSQNHNYPPRVFKDRDVLRLRIVGRVIKSLSTF